MGKNKEGEEIGKGISQRADGYYIARFTGIRKNRLQKVCGTLEEAQRWLDGAKLADERGIEYISPDITLNEWFDIFITEIKADISHATRTNYKGRYKNNIKPIIGHMKMQDIRPVHCISVLNSMASTSKATRQLVRGCMATIFNSAVDNDIIQKSPINRTVKVTGQANVRDGLTINEQHAVEQYEQERDGLTSYITLFILQTGLRTSEVRGLKYSDVDWVNRVIHITHNLVWNEETKEWVTGDPKTFAGIRDIPLTNRALSILQEMKSSRARIKVIDMEFSDYIFLDKKGSVLKFNNLNAHLYRLSKSIGIRRFSAHSLRHTFATRCIEAGMKPKVLQKILGHSSISITMNRYVHISQNEMQREMMLLERFAN